MSNAVLELRDVRPLTAELGHPLNLSIRRGEVCLLTGRPGSGKTTLIKTLLGLITPQAGRVFLWGHEISRTQASQLRHLRRRMGVLLEQGGLISAWSGLDNLMLPLRFRGTMTSGEMEQHIIRRAERFEISARQLQQRVDALAGRQYRRLALLRALISDPDVLVIDHLPHFLTPREQPEKMILNEICREECTLIISAPTHWRFQFPTRAAQVVNLNQGTIKSQAPLLGHEMTQSITDAGSETGWA